MCFGTVNRIDVQLNMYFSVDYTSTVLEICILNHVTQWSFHDENWSIGCRFRQLMALIESVLDRACYRARIVCTAVRLYGTWLENTAFNASIFIHSKCHLHAIRQFVNLNKLLRLSMTCFFFCFFFLHSFCYSFIFNQNYRCSHENLNIV